MASVDAVRVPSGVVRIAFTDRDDGDFAVAAAPDELASRRRSIVDAPWTWLRQVHGADTVVVRRAGEHAGVEADAAVTTCPGAPLAIMTADCAPVVLVAEAGVGVAHAGWRGLADGVVEATAGALADAGAGAPIATIIGPCISPMAYEFGTEQLDRIADRLGPAVRSTTAWNTPALDVAAAVAAACRRAGWPEAATAPSCTSDERWYSHRTRADAGRQATVAWLESAAGPATR